jgi:hypothetical protein
MVLFEAENESWNLPSSESQHFHHTEITVNPTQEVVVITTTTTTKELIFIYLFVVSQALAHPLPHLIRRKE